MKKNIVLLVAALLMSAFVFSLSAQAQTDRKLNVIIIGAHPDDADKVGGTAYKWKLAGFDVMMVSFTNGDAGHQTMKADELAKLRREEARKAGEVIGIKYITLDNHDGQLVPSYENRLQMIRIIREHKADLVVFPRPYDYHPDHRYTGTLVLDAAYMVTVPSVLPEVPRLERNPMFLYMSDGFTIPAAFVADVAIDIDDVVEKKVDMYHEHKSQMYEWLPFNRGNLSSVPVSDADRRAWLSESRKRSWDATQYRSKLIELYGAEKGAAIRYCETFQDSGYGTRLNSNNMKTYFPFLP
jgi:LmbE family N-acetylglucosaminyl deacetylase